MVWTVLNDYAESMSSVGLGFMAGTPSGAISRSSGKTQNYDGTSWSTDNLDPQSGYRFGGTGTYSDALRVGGGGSGSTGKEVSKWDGTSWSADTDLPVVIYQGGVVGTPSDAHAIEYLNSPYQTYSFNGSAWTQEAAVNYTQRYGQSYAGSTSSAMHACAKFITDTASSDCEQWDGSTFSAAPDTTQGRRRAIKGSGSSGDFSIIIGGRDGPSGTEKFQLTSWTVDAGSPNNTSLTDDIQGLNLSFSSMMAGGGLYDGEKTEEFDGPPECWNFTAHYRNSNRLFKQSGPGSFPKILRVPKNLDLSTGKMIDDGQEIDSDQYDIEEI